MGREVTSHPPWESSRTRWPGNPSPAPPGSRYMRRKQAPPCAARADSLATGTSLSPTRKRHHSGRQASHRSRRNPTQGFAHSGADCCLRKASSGSWTMRRGRSKPDRRISISKSWGPESRMRRPSQCSANSAASRHWPMASLFPSLKQPDAGSRMRSVRLESPLKSKRSLWARIADLRRSSSGGNPQPQKSAVCGLGITVGQRTRPSSRNCDSISLRAWRSSVMKSPARPEGSSSKRREAPKSRSVKDCRPVAGS